MSDQPEALRLAEFLEMHWCNVEMPEAKAAAELRRQHAEIESLKAECDALRAELKFIADHDLSGTDLTVAGHIAHALIGKARAALKEAK